MGPASHSASHNYPRRASEWRAPSWARCCGLLSADINLQLAPNIALEQLAASLCSETKTPPTHSHVSGRSSLFDSVRFKFSLVTLCPPPPPAPSMLLCLDEPFVPLIDCSRRISCWIWSAFSARRHPAERFLRRGRAEQCAVVAVATSPSDARARAQLTSSLSSESHCSHHHHQRQHQRQQHQQRWKKQRN